MRPLHIIQTSKVVLHPAKNGKQLGHKNIEKWRTQMLHDSVEMLKSKNKKS